MASRNGKCNNKRDSERKFEVGIFDWLWSYYLLIYVHSSKRQQAEYTNK